jgi:hypothetical protein
MSSPEKPETTDRSSPRPPALGEGALLTATTALAYGVAFLYETGYASCYGYPNWLIEIGLSNVVMAWISIALATLAIGAIYFVVGILLPARILRVLLFSRAAVFIGAGVAMMVASIFFDEYDEWVFLVGMGAVLLLMFVPVWIEGYRVTSDGRFVDRINAANDHLARWHNSGPRLRSDPEDVLLIATLKTPIIRELYAGSLLLLFPLAIVMASANGFGSWMASRQTVLWVSSDKPPLVALRRYRETVLATPLGIPASSIAQPILVLPWQSADRTWTLRVLDTRTARRLVCK